MMIIDDGVNRTIFDANGFFNYFILFYLLFSFLGSLNLDFSLYFRRPTTQLNRKIQHRASFSFHGGCCFFPFSIFLLLFFCQWWIDLIIHIRIVHQLFCIDRFHWKKCQIKNNFHKNNFHAQNNYFLFNFLQSQWKFFKAKNLQLNFVNQGLGSFACFADSLDGDIKFTLKLSNKKRRTSFLFIYSEQTKSQVGILNMWGMGFLEFL